MDNYDWNHQQDTIGRNCTQQLWAYKQDKKNGFDANQQWQGSETNHNSWLDYKNMVDKSWRNNQHMIV